MHILSAVRTYLLLLLTAGLLLPVAAAAVELPGDPYHPRDRLIGDEALLDPWDPLANWRMRSEPRHALPGPFENCPHDYDVLHYELNFSSFDHLSNYLDGHTVIDFVSRVDALGSIDLDLTSQLTVSSIVRDGTDSLSYSQVGDVLNVQFAAPPDSGDTVSIDVAYEGVPWNEGAGGFGGFWFRGFPSTAFSMGIGLAAEPPAVGHAWFPCWDWPCDKATVDLNVEVPLDKMAVANGELLGVDSTATDHTWRWSHDYPIATYLIAVAVAPYKVLSDTVVTDPRIKVYHHPGYKKKATVSFQNVDVMMEAFETRFGTYPFEKFAFMVTNIGDMEHQTCVSHAAGLVDSTNTYDPILAHELMHMWFGDCVTYGSWADIWLSEGFGTYGPALFREHQGGMSAYHDHVTTSILNRIITSGKTDGIYDPPDRWGVINYEKGASLLHMLRGVLDDDVTFFQALNDFFTAHAYGNVVTADFTADVNASTGQNLNWFFDPWLYGEGHPVYEYGWSPVPLGGGSWRVDVGIRQVQTTATIFDMPVDFRVQTASGDFDFSERIDSAAQTVSFVVPAEPTGLLVDPDDWILDVQQVSPTSADFGPEVAAAQALSLLPARPNPFRTRTEIPFYLPRGGRTTVTIHDAAGRTVRSFGTREEMPGARSLHWDRRDGDGGKVASGVYFVRLEGVDGVRSGRVVVID
jgi:aminopeptidase N